MHTDSKHFALIGKHLSHSYSQKYFETKFREMALDGYLYSLVPIAEISDIRKVVNDYGLDGFNVTIPYKREIIPLLDDISETAKAIGAVNTVVVKRHANGTIHLEGHNTDGPAFADTLSPLLQPWHKEALILGTGGAAQAVRWALEKEGINSVMVSRNPSQESISYSEAYRQAANRLLIVNATPVGMFPHSDASPWRQPELLTPQHLCYDIVYNPSPTLFMSQAERQGAIVFDGLAMLYRQADLAFGLWQQNQ